MNQGLCNVCRERVPATVTKRDGRVYLVKNCPACGQTETLIASDAKRYYDKHGLDTGFQHGACNLNCRNCRHPMQPNIVFLDITNRCNMNCPICINNTPSMGFLFEPPIEYFDKIFEHYSHYDPKPSFQLFGGEPTVRDDLLDIIRMARSYGLSARVVTNGIRLANEEYCRALVESRATILIAYDGANPKVYEILRGNAKFLDLKLKALENIGKQPRAKVALMSLVGKGFNDKELPELFDYVHERRRFIRGIYFMPLAHTWDQKEFDLEPDRITSDDIERMVDASFPDDRVDFIPAGFIGQVPTVSRCLGVKPLPFAGAHPNCESMYMLVSDGERFLPVARYFKKSILEVCRRLLEIERKLAARERALRTSFFGKLLRAVRLEKSYLKTRAAVAVGGMLLRCARVAHFFKGWGPFKLYHMAALLLSLVVGARTKTALARHTTAQGTIQLIILPFEDPCTLETERLERCPSAFAFYDPEADKVKDVPVCAWGLHKTDVMKRISEFYGTKEPVKASDAGRVADSVSG